MCSPGSAVVNNLPANAGDTGLTPGPGRSHMPWGKWAHAVQLLKRICPQPVLYKTSYRNEKAAHCHHKVTPDHHTKRKSLQYSEGPAQQKKKKKD